MSEPNPNILDQMAQVEKAAEKATPRPWTSSALYVEATELVAKTETVADAKYTALAANHAPAIIAFARRLLEVAQAAQQYRDMEDYSGDVSEERLALYQELDALERDYPSVLGRKEGDNGQP